MPVLLTVSDEQDEHQKLSKAVKIGTLIIAAFENSNFVKICESQNRKLQRAHKGKQINAPALLVEADFHLLNIIKFMS